MNCGIFHAKIDQLAQILYPRIIPRSVHILSVESILCMNDISYTIKGIAFVFLCVIVWSSYRFRQTIHTAVKSNFLYVRTFAFQEDVLLHRFNRRISIDSANFVGCDETTRLQQCSTSFIVKSATLPQSELTFLKPVHLRKRSRNKRILRNGCC